MSLLAPFFLLGLAGIALPIWLHRLQTQTDEKELFSSSMLLEASEQRVHMQKKITLHNATGISTVAAINPRTGIYKTHLGEFHRSDYIL